jgi:hypothetical protein
MFHRLRPRQRSACEAPFFRQITPEALAFGADWAIAFSGLHPDRILFFRDIRPAIKGEIMAHYKLAAAVALCLSSVACGSGSVPENGSKGGSSPTVRLQPGLWAAGGKAAAAEDATGADGRRCISAQEAQATANGSEAEIRAALEAQTKKDGCKLESLAITDRNITFEQTCSGAKLKMSSTYNGDTSSTVMSGGGMPEMKTESHRVGDC